MVVETVVAIFAIGVWLLDRVGRQIFSELVDRGKEEDARCERARRLEEAVEAALGSAERRLGDASAVIASASAEPRGRPGRASQRR